MEYPYIPLYVHDFAHGTMDMTAEELGAYMRLLMYQWDKGHLPNDDARLCNIARVKQKVLVQVKVKFDVCADGNLRNARMEAERTKTAATYAKNRKNGSEGVKKRWDKHRQNIPSAIANGIPNNADNTIANGIPSAIAIGIPKQYQSPTERDSNHTKPYQTNSETNDAHAPDVADVGHLPKAAHAPRFEQVVEWFDRLGKTEQDARLFYAHYDALGWMLKGSKIVNAHSLAYKWTANGIDNQGFAPSNGMSEADKRLASRVS